MGFRTPNFKIEISSEKLVDSSWNVMAHGDARERKWRGNWRMEWVASTLHTTSEHGVSSITTADAHTSAASRRMNWRPHRFKWNRTFRRKAKSGFCACAITFQLTSSSLTSSRLTLSYLLNSVTLLSPMICSTGLLRRPTFLQNKYYIPILYLPWALKNI